MNNIIICSGIDIISINRIKQALSKNNGFKSGIFSENEINYCDNKGKPARFFGGRWCVKESFIKALNELGVTDITPFHEIIVQKESGSPELLLVGDAKRILKRTLPSDERSHSISISISHDEAANIASASCTIVILT